MKRFKQINSYYYIIIIITIIPIYPPDPCACIVGQKDLINLAATTQNLEKYTVSWMKCKIKWKLQKIKGHCCDIYP